MDLITRGRVMQNAIKLRIYTGILVIFGLFAVYSTSIWKSFDQRLTVDVVQNIETVKAFNTFLDETILKSTQDVLSKKSLLHAIGENSDMNSELNTGDRSSTGMLVSNASSQLPTLDTLDVNNDEDLQLVSQGKKRIQKRNNYVLFFSQIRSLVISLFAVLFVLFVPLSWFKNKKLIYMVTIGVVLFQICVFLPDIGARNGEARGWVNIPGLPNMQPSEFFKLGYVFFMSYRITKRKQIVDTKKFLVQFASINAIILLVILAIPDFGTLFILALTGAIMARYSGLSLKKLSLLGGIAIFVALIGISVIGLLNPNNYALDRLVTFMERDPEVKEKRKLREDWQIQQGLVAIGAGGFWGQGYGKGLQKMGHLPEAYSDMIFSAFSEEVGFVGNMFLFGLYIALFFAVLRQIALVRDAQIRTLGVGILSLIIVQVFVHIGVNLEILPNTGLTLPFVSHGGTALMVNLIELTLLYKILQGKEQKFSVKGLE